MKRPTVFRLGALFVVACTTLLVAAQQQKSTTIPEFVSKIVRQHYPSANIVGTDVGDDDGLTEYRIRVKMAPDGRGARMEIREDVGVTSIEEQLRQEQLPPRIRRALEKHFSGAKFRDAHKESEVRTTYQIDILVEGKRREVTFSPSGKVLEVD